MAQPRHASVSGCRVERPPPNRVGSHDGMVEGGASMARSHMCPDGPGSCSVITPGQHSPSPPLQVNLTTERECRFGCDDAHPSCDSSIDGDGWHRGSARRHLKVGGGSVSASFLRTLGSRHFNMALSRELDERAVPSTNPANLSTKLEVSVGRPTRCQNA